MALSGVPGAVLVAGRRHVASLPADGERVPGAPALLLPLPGQHPGGRVRHGGGLPAGAARHAAGDRPLPSPGVQQVLCASGTCPVWGGESQFPRVVAAMAVGRSGALTRSPWSVLEICPGRGGFRQGEGSAWPSRTPMSFGGAISTAGPRCLSSLLPTGLARVSAAKTTVMTANC